ncbi:MAG TPA: TadE/TadG family type IV pilus assembly protein [Phenylobacterium sp.]|uniref:TadE/TadG family type IV pilus assembly protein n=1 Tax=Phenylobacterium sp. TaxID=1871053 RepID=UPI002B492921|nr:TadE/TadG family type IV pilus assembly protein [Phenylobacterium sp.]HKR90062.1 TadE/TadG family type IV pilus assembly protein [Phenylobacterium sp.]
MRLAKAWRRCERGAAAIEFAMAAPLLIVFHLGTVEVVQALEAHRRIAHVAGALADLTAQEQSVSPGDLNDILAAGALLVTPFSTSQLGERITSFTADANGVVKQDWSVSQNWTLAGDPSLPAGYLQANESVIVADASYTFASLFGMVLPKSMTMLKHAYLRPRISTQVTRATS